MKEIEIGKNEAGQRLNKLLKKVLNDAPDSFLYKMLRKKNIKLNGGRAEGKEILQEGDRVQIYLSDETFEKFRKEKKPNPIETLARKKEQAPAAFEDDRFIYLDEDIAVINKPANLLSQKAKPEDISANELLIDYLLTHDRLTEAQMETFRPSVCNRLDRNTGGVLLAGTSLRGSRMLSEILRDRSLHKYYLAVVVGECRETGRKEAYLRKDPETNLVEVRRFDAEEDTSSEDEFRRMTVKASKEEVQQDPGWQRIEIECRPLSYGVYKEQGYTLMQVKLITGKSHQIRAHLASLSYPIVGDHKYGDPRANRRVEKDFGLRWQALLAYRVTFPKQRGWAEIYNGKVFHATLPEEMDKMVREIFGDTVMFCKEE